jgi:hypothetical protein
MSWEHVSSRLGNVQPATRSIAQEIYEAADAAGHEIWFMWGIGPSSEHSTGRALDLMVRNKAAGDFIRNYVWEHRERLRLRHVIWWQAITSTVTQPGVVRQMADRGNNTANHKDHPHILVLPGEYQPLPEPVAPKPPTVVAPTSPKVVKDIQKAVKVKDDGKWGPITDRRVMRMRSAARARRGWPTRVSASFDIRDVQEVVGTKTDGFWGPKSDKALLDWVKKFQKVLDVKSDGAWGPKTDGRLLTLRRRYLNRF